MRRWRILKTGVQIKAGDAPPVHVSHAIELNPGDTFTGEDTFHAVDISAVQDLEVALKAETAKLKWEIANRWEPLVKKLRDENAGMKKLLEASGWRERDPVVQEIDEMKAKP